MSTVKPTAALAILVLSVAFISASSQQTERTLIDPATQAQWVLHTNSQHPGGPGKLVQLHAALPSTASVITKVPQGRVVIRAGDRLVVEDSSRMLSARYTAVALAPAAVGAIFLVRFAVGVKPIPVQALGPGRAALLVVRSPSEAQQ